MKEKAYSVQGHKVNILLQREQWRYDMEPLAESKTKAPGLALGACGRMM